ncbi:MAG: non-heme iron oxygenase ferredoxin subunit [Candidatus Eremiobacteraeota bacterium]|nr:non-heme iron oxygenase ferredoxin subunit [Candidatus Eremiobacteraeota bacterium]
MALHGRGSQRESILRVHVSGAPRDGAPPTYAIVAKHRVAKVSDIAPGTTHQVVADSVRMLLCNVEGKIYAIEDVCTHDGGPLEQGTLEGECIVCPRHGATFDVKTGDALTLPAVVPLMTFDVTVERDEIYVEA